MFGFFVYNEASWNVILIADPTFVFINPVIMCYLTLHWLFLINLQQLSLSINSYVYSCYTIWAGLFKALLNGLMWLRFVAVNYDSMGSNPADTVFLCYNCLLTQQRLNTVSVQNVLL